MSRRKKPFPFFLWHRRIGLVAMLLLVILAITGIMLNHTESLRLDEKRVNSDWLFNWYGMTPEGEPVSYQAGSDWVSQWGEQLFFNDRLLTKQSESLQGAIEVDDIRVIVLQSQVLLVDEAGELIERMAISAKTHLRRIGRSDQQIIVDNGEQTYIADTQLTSWKATQLPKHIMGTISWATPVQIDTSLRDELLQTMRGDGLSLEQVILDLHSGRLLHPTWGVLIMDASAVMMMLLGFSGLWIWWSRKIKIRSKKHYKKRHN